MTLTELLEKYRGGEELSMENALEAIKALNPKLSLSLENIDWERIVGYEEDFFIALDTTSKDLKDVVKDYILEGLDWEYSITDLIKVSFND